MGRWVIVCDNATAPVLDASGAWDCPMSSQQVVSTDALLSSSSSGSLPPAEDVAALWSVAFSLVMVCYVVGKAVGSCLELIRKG